MSERELGVRYGQAEVSATLIRRTETVTFAPSLSSLSRIVPQVASWNRVCRRPIRHSASSSKQANDANHERSWLARRVAADVRPLLLFDPVLDLAAAAVDLLVQHPAGDR
jgi:hypothetical protein